jgi:hypothetical protein
VFSQKDLGAIKSLSIEGKIVLTYPHDLERFVFDVRDATKPVETVIDGVRIIFAQSVSAEGRSYEVNLATEEREDERRFIIWLEDEEGRWLTDLVDADTPVSSKSSASAAFDLDISGTAPAKLGVARCIGVDTVEVPFVVRGIPVPAR